MLFRVSFDDDDDDVVIEGMAAGLGWMKGAHIHHVCILDLNLLRHI